MVLGQFYIVQHCFCNILRLSCNKIFSFYFFFIFFSCGHHLLAEIFFVVKKNLLFFLNIFFSTILAVLLCCLEPEMLLIEIKIIKLNAEIIKPNSVFGLLQKAIQQVYLLLKYEYGKYHEILITVNTSFQ